MPSHTQRVTDGSCSRKLFCDRSQLPPAWPTHHHTPAFWEQLGRTVATFGFLEEMLRKAIYVYTGNQPLPENEEEAAAAKKKWCTTLEKAISDTLVSLAETYLRAVRRSEGEGAQDVKCLVDKISEVARLRNVICHGSWRKPNALGGAPLVYVNRKKRSFETVVDLKFLEHLQSGAAELAVDVVESITQRGLPFPGVQEHANASS